MTDPHRLSPETLDEIRFLHLVEMLTQQAMIALGKAADPTTGEVAEVDLEAAKATIDMLGMIENRTRGNLSDREKGYLELQLTNLRLNYVNEIKVQRAGQTRAAATPPPAETPATGTPTEPPAAKEEPRPERTSEDGRFVDRRSATH